MRPPSAKNAIEVTRYIRPIILWSVVRSIRPSSAPFWNSVTGKGRETIGSGPEPSGPGASAAGRSAVVVTTCNLAVPDGSIPAAHDPELI